MESFFFISLRMLTFLMIWPVFDKIRVSFFIKFTLAFGLSIMLFPLLIQETPHLPKTGLFWIGFKEIFIGFSLGFLSRIFFVASHISGNLIQATFFHHQIEGEDIFSDFQIILITVLFFCLNGHYAFVSALLKSFELLPISNDWIHFDGFSWSLFFQQIVEIGLRLSLPFVICIFLLRVLTLLTYRWSPYLRTFLSDTMLAFGAFLFIFLTYLPFLSDFVNSLIQFSLERMFYWMKVV